MKNLAGQPALATEMERHRNLLAERNKLTEEDKCPILPGPKTRQKNQQKSRKNRSASQQASG